MKYIVQILIKPIVVLVEHIMWMDR